MGLKEVHATNIFVYHLLPCYSKQVITGVSIDMVEIITVSVQMQPHSLIEPHPIQNVMQPQSNIGFETIQPQLEYNPILANFGIFK